MDRRRSTSTPTPVLAHRALAGIALPLFGIALLLASAATPAAAVPPLQALAGEAVGADQGVYAVAADGTLLASMNAHRAVHPASVTKIASTLALLARLGPDHRFETRVDAKHEIVDGTLEGDLILTAGGDPFFVFESAFFILAELRERGLRRVSGSLVVEGPLIFNWQPDPSGRRLERALAGHDGTGAWTAAQAARPQLAGLARAEARLAFGAGSTLGDAGERRELIVYRSPKLVTMLKAFNGYSNNVFELLSAAIGGASEVGRFARERVGVELAAEITIDNAAGAGRTNRLSPRATVALIDALAAEASTHGLDLTDLLPVAGIDAGTLEDRYRKDDLRGALVGKTGTYGSLGASALAGIVRTRRYGDVRFAVLNKDLTVAVARARQDAFLDGLVAAAGGVETLAYTPASAAPISGAVAESAR